MKKLIIMLVSSLLVISSNITYANVKGSSLSNRTNNIKRRNQNYRTKRDTQARNRQNRLRELRDKQARKSKVYNKSEKIRKAKLHENNKKDFRKWTPERAKSNNSSNDCLYNYTTRKLNCRDRRIK